MSIATDLLWFRTHTWGEGPQRRVWRHLGLKSKKRHATFKETRKARQRGAVRLFVRSTA